MALQKGRAKLSLTGSTHTQIRVVRLGASNVATTSSSDHDSGRIVAIVGPDGVGKSKVCAALLELGKSGDGLPKLDNHFAEKERLLEWEAAESRRNFSCYNHVYSQEASGRFGRLHLIDTPGHSDREPLVQHALHAAHGAVVVCSVIPGTRGAGRSFGAVETANKPAVVFLNGVDKADDAEHFDAALAALEGRLGVRPVVLYAPAHAGGTTDTGPQLLNVLEGTVCSALDCSFTEDHGSRASGDLAAWAKKLRDQQIETLATVDDDMMEAFVEFDGDVPRMMIESALHRAIAAGTVIPLVAGSAKCGLGLDALQEVVHTFIPPAMDQSQILEDLGVDPIGGIPFESRSPFVGWAFAEHTHDDKRFLEVRVLGGSIQANSELVVSSSDPNFKGSFRPGQLFRHGLRGQLKAATSAGPGDLVLVPVSAGSPAGFANPVNSNGLLLTDAKFPIPMHTGSQKGKHEERPRGACTYAVQLNRLKEKDRDKLLKSLSVMLREDDGLTLVEDPRTGEKQLSFMGALHMELVRERLAEEFKVLLLPLGPPCIGYCATPKKQASGTGSHTLGGKTRIRKGMEHKHSGKVDASVKVQVEPSGRGQGISVEDPAGKIDPTRGGKVAQEAASGVERGIRRGLLDAGPGGIPVTDVIVRVLSAEARNEEAVAAAAEDAVRRAMEAYGSELLEPVVHLEIDAPEIDLDGVLADLKTRRGEVFSARPSDEGARTVEVNVPLREISGYEDDLAKMTHGEGFYRTKETQYRDVDTKLKWKIMEKELHCTQVF